MPERGDAVCSTLAHRELPLAEGLARIAALGFATIELGIFDDYTHLTVSDLEADPAGVRRELVATVERAGLRAVSLNTAVPLDAPDVARARFGHLLDLATELGAGFVTVEAPASGTPLERAAEQLAPLVAQAQAAGISVAVETHVFLVTELPADAARLAALVPGLGLTLDPAHFAAGPGRGHPLDAVYPSVRNLHVRDAGATWAEIQLDMGTGTVDFPAVFAALDAHGYDGLCVIEYMGAGEAAGVDEKLAGARTYLREHWA